MRMNRTKSSGNCNTSTISRCRQLAKSWSPLGDCRCSWLLQSKQLQNTRCADDNVAFKNVVNWLICVRVAPAMSPHSFQCVFSEPAAWTGLASVVLAAWSREECRRPAWSCNKCFSYPPKGFNSSDHTQPAGDSSTSREYCRNILVFAQRLWWHTMVGVVCERCGLRALWFPSLFATGVLWPIVGV